MKKSRTRHTPAVRGLSPESRRLFKMLAREYDISDAGGVQILLSGLTSLDLAVAAESAIWRDGLVVLDRWGQAKPHPLTPAARDHRAAWLASLRALNLSIGDPPKPGRPEGT